MNNFLVIFFFSRLTKRVYVSLPDEHVSDILGTKIYAEMFCYSLTIFMLKPFVIERFC